MSKKETYTNIVAELSEQLQDDCRDIAISIIDKYIKPKKLIFIDDFAILTDNTLTHIKCSKSGVILPATLDYFPEVRIRGLINEQGIMLGISSKQALTIEANFFKFKREKLAELVKGLTVDNAEATKKEMAKINSMLVDYSSVKE